MDATLENQLFEYQNFALHTQDDSCTLNALKMHLVFGSGISGGPHFSSRMKCCIRVCLQRFKRELKPPNQRKGAFLRHLRRRNHPEYEAQSCSTKKVGFSKWCRFFDRMIFRQWPLPSGGF